MWANTWSFTTSVNVTTGTEKSKEYPDCYYGTDSITLEPYLEFVQLSTPVYANNSWVYNKITGVLTYTLYTQTPSTYTVSLAHCYRYLKIFEYIPTVSILVNNEDRETKSCTVQFTITNLNSTAVYYTVTIGDDRDSLIYKKESVVSKQSTAIITAELISPESFLISFYYQGYKTVNISKNINPFN